MEVKIKQGNEMLDATIEMVEGVMVVSPKVVKFEPKDGDVVYLGGFYDFVFIYKENITSEAYYYVSLLLKDNKIEFPDGGHIGYVKQLRPATEEEKRKLFGKLAEEGYEFDFEKKKLVKLKWEPKEGGLYYAPFLFATIFQPVSKFFTSDSGTCLEQKNVGWCFKTPEECERFCEKLNKKIKEVEP